MKRYPGYDRHLVKRSRELRKNMTFSEVIFWKKVRNYSFMGYDFGRQKPVLSFIVDFYCHQLNLIVEIDGITHHDAAIEFKDEHRNILLKKSGFEIMRFSGYQMINDIQNVMRSIQCYIELHEEKFGVDPRVLMRR